MYGPPSAQQKLLLVQSTVAAPEKHALKPGNLGYHLQGNLALTPLLLMLMSIVIICTPLFIDNCPDPIGDPLICFNKTGMARDGSFKKIMFNQETRRVDSHKRKR